MLYKGGDIYEDNFESLGKGFISPEVCILRVSLIRHPLPMVIALLMPHDPLLEGKNPRMFWNGAVWVNLLFLNFIDQIIGDVKNFPCWENRRSLHPCRDAIVRWGKSGQLVELLFTLQRVLPKGF